MAHFVLVAWQANRSRRREKTEVRLRDMADRATENWHPLLSKGAGFDLLTLHARKGTQLGPKVQISVYPLIAPHGTEPKALAADPTARLSVLPPYVGAIVNQTASEAIVFNDYAGVGRVYYAVSPEVVVVSSRIELLQRVTSSHFALDEKALAQFASIGWIMGDRTPFRGVRLLDAGGSISVKADGPDTASVRITEGSPIYRTDNDPRIEDVASRLLDVVGGITPLVDRPVSIGLSGGRDSRLVACLLSCAGVPFEAFTIGNFDAETEIARFVASVVAPGGELTVRERPVAREPGEFEASARSLVLSHEGMYEPAYIGATKPTTSESLPQWATRPRLGGAGGELGHAHYYSHLALDDCLTMGESEAFDRLAVRLRLAAFGSPSSVEAVKAEFVRLTDEGVSRGFHGVKVLDWFYLRERLRRWSGLAAVHAWNVAPLASHAFAEVALMQPISEAHSSLLHRRLITHFFPSLEDVQFFKASRQTVSPPPPPLLISKEEQDRLLNSTMLQETCSVDRINEALGRLKQSGHTTMDAAVIKRAYWLLAVEDRARELRRESEGYTTLRRFTQWIPEQLTNPAVTYRSSMKHADGADRQAPLPTEGVKWRPQTTNRESRLMRNPEHQKKPPHIVMVVGNRVRGDSRVEKTARTAHKAGYKVTVLGLKDRTVLPCDVIDEVPVFRVSPEYRMYQSWRLDNQADFFDQHADGLAARRLLRRMRDRGRQPANGWRRPFLRVGRGLRRRSEDFWLAMRGVWSDTRLTTKYWLMKLRVRGFWRRAWPHIADLELAFAEAIVELEPDILYVHDYHALPAARTAKSILLASGHTTKSVYDAHEWLPGVEIPGPRVRGASWVVAEAESIGSADAVITVSNQLAERLKRRHGLKEVPSVVLNAPSSERKPLPQDGRWSVREDCGLGPDTDLLVYVGGIAEKRGLDTVVHALAALPEAHLAMVAPSARKRRRELLELASELGVDERLHVLDYVPANTLTSYISSASVGLSPLHDLPNHQVSLGTKIREYLHAGLPIVGSDVSALAEFLRATGVGAVFQAEDSGDCARVIKEVLANRTSYAGAIHPELLAEHSWEQQEPVLIELWERLGGRRPEPRAPRRGPHLVVGPVVNPGRSRRLLEAVCSETAGTGELIERAALTKPTGRLVDKVEEYRRFVADSDGVILEGLRPLFGGLLESGDIQLMHLAEVRAVAVMIDAIAGVDLDEMLDRVPDSWLLTLDPSTRETISRQGRRTRRDISQTRSPVLATSLFPMRELANVTWLPTVVDVARRESSIDGPLRVLVSPEPRGALDALVPDRVAKLASQGVTVELPTAHDDVHPMLRGVDVFVDALGHGTYTDLAAQAMGHGCAVVTRLDPEVASLLPPSCPTLSASPEDVVDVISDLVADRARILELSKRSIAYAREFHDGRRSAAIVRDTLGWQA